MRLTWLLFSFEGRIGRMTFWAFALAALGTVYAGGALIADFADLPLAAGIDLAALIALLPTLAVQAKRWHDRGKSAWWILINLVPVVGPIWALIECGALEGTRGSNAFGADPLGRSAASGPSADTDRTTRGGDDRG